MNKISPISLIAMFVVAPAMATPSHTSATFPANELMQEDYTYTNQANYTNMGVYSGTVTANANYDWTVFDIPAGYMYTSFDQSTNTPILTLCPEYIYCPGQTGATVNTISDGGGLECPNMEYYTSHPGSTAITDCYRACNIANMGSNGTIADIPHATAVSGEDHYGDGVDTCVATACENGWSVSNGVCVANTITITWNGATAAAISANNAGTTTYGSDIRTPQSVDSTQIPIGKHFVGWKFTKPPFDLSLLGSYNFPTGTDLIDFNGTATSEAQVYGLTENGSWGSTYESDDNPEFNNYKLKGEAKCSTSATGTPNDTYGQHCWCRVTGYMANGGSVWQDVQQSGWIHVKDYTADLEEYGESCDFEDYCINSCTNISIYQ